ncbi:MAG TPA: hypothetical protein VH722_07690 [Alphaproteobacteria bacterium]|jgi:hypothetical protein|nr:hypothetical protein [Alphaproteobacteria bacterium]
MAEDFRPVPCGNRVALLLAACVLLVSNAAGAGCLHNQPSNCSPTINADGDVGQTSYTSLPFAGSIFAQSWGASAGLTPANLFWASGKTFTDAQTMREAKEAADNLTAKGIVPAGGAQRWEDTYEISQPASLFHGEPGWIANDRKAQGLTGKPEFQAWVKWQKAHTNLFTLGSDGGAEGVNFRQWRGSWGHISPLMPLPAADWPPGVKNATYGDWFAYRWGQTAQRSGAYGIILSDFTDSQPDYPSFKIGFNPQLIDGFAKAAGIAVPAGPVPARADFINSHAYIQWNNYLAEGYAKFYTALASRLAVGGHRPLIIDQCGDWPSARRLQGTDAHIIAQAMTEGEYVCIWDNQTMQVGRSGQPMIWGIGGMVIAAAREPNIRNGGNLSADDNAFWRAAAQFWSNLSSTEQHERGLKELKRVWLETAWSHIATRQGTVRRALSFMSRDYWDQGTIDATVQKLITTIVPTKPLGFAVYYSEAGEQAAEVGVPGGGSTYMNPNLLMAFKQGGGPVGYYVGNVALAKLTAAARPVAWVVLDNRTPAAEKTRLAKIAPVLTSLSAAKSFSNAPLSYSNGLTGMGFYDQNNRRIVTVSNPGDAAVAGTVTLKGFAAGFHTVTNLLTNASSSSLTLNGQVSLPVTVARWDTQAYAVSQ